jgi:hypothetical protein
MSRSLLLQEQAGFDDADDESKSTPGHCDLYLQSTTSNAAAVPQHTGRSALLEGLAEHGSDAEWLADAVSQATDEDTAAYGPSTQTAQGAEVPGIAQLLRLASVLVFVAIRKAGTCEHRHQHHGAVRSSGDAAAEKRRAFELTCVSSLLSCFERICAAMSGVPQLESASSSSAIFGPPSTRALFFCGALGSLVALARETKLSSSCSTTPAGSHDARQLLRRLVDSRSLIDFVNSAQVARSPLAMQILCGLLLRLRLCSLCIRNVPNDRPRRHDVALDTEELQEIQRCHELTLHDYHGDPSAVRRDVLRLIAFVSLKA